MAARSPRSGARTKLRAYFLANLNRVMDSGELREVAGGTSEWARRVRELRTEEGYLILTHHDRSDLRPGQYLLESATPQPAFGASNITPGRPDLNKLLVQVRRATSVDQLALLEWLQKKFKR